MPGDRTPRALSARGRPPASTEQAAEILASVFGCSGTLAGLPGERDRNFLVGLADGERAVLKLSHPAERPELLELQHRVLGRLGGALPAYRFPRPIPTVHGADVATVEVAGYPTLVRLMTWVPGVPLAGASPRRSALLGRVGSMLGALDRTLADVSDDAARRPLQWDLRRAEEVIGSNLASIADSGRRDRAERWSEASLMGLAPWVGELREGLIHGDANDHNVLVEDVSGDPERADARTVSGLIDFGDMVHSWIVAEPAIACAYAMLDQADPAAPARALVQGYHRAFPLTPPEIAAIPHLVTLRLLVSVCLSAAQSSADPTNAYLTVSEAPAWRLLDELARTGPDLLHCQLREAAELEPCPAGRELVRWLEGDAPAARPVVAPDPAAAPRVVLDLSVASLEQGSDAWELDARSLGERLFARMAEVGAAVGVGRYDEARGWYGGPAYARAGDDLERRTIHLGVDLFVPPRSPVMAPFDGAVHSVQDNARPLDYGPTLILEHRPPNGPRFYTLFGHLGADVLDRASPGDEVSAGQQVASVGDVAGNGNWPPHLHFQLIADLLGQRGDFPGVAPPSDRSLWLSICPDPNLVLGIPGLSPAPRGRSPEALIAARRARLGPNLSVSYRSPLTIVRGVRQFLIDAEGRRYLDCVNNVAHVGHSHPRVVAAVARQMAVLNTNTRYLYESLVEYAERLSDTLPAPLRVCFFVCSGSEANELALRLARTSTGARDVVVVEGAYHGNTSSLVDLSPYKHDGPGGDGAPDWVHVVPVPDVYRGRYRGAEDAGARYAETVSEALAALHAAGRRPAAFFCESLLSCAGQIVLPKGYLSRAAAAVRARGGLVVADEVQVGFGRVGSHFWAFEAEGVVPDIVTLGKPIGNGHPIGAVVTTPEVAAAFDTGMEYFNTFGGNPVSCAAGLAVLDVLRDEGLQERAADAGAVLLEGLRELQERHPVIGDVRGRGLFVGLELVKDRAARTPAGAHAAHLVERMRARGILLSTDGPHHNVIKIKPPLPFGEEDAGRLIRTLDRVLSEDVFRTAF